MLEMRAKIFSLHRLVIVILLGLSWYLTGSEGRQIRRDLQSLQFPFLDPDTLMLKTSWGRKDGKPLNPRICKRLEMFLYERKWTGGLARTDCGRGVFECEVNDEGNLVVEMDIRRCRVQQFRSYQLCLTPGERMCTMLFSMEMKIPYMETEEEKVEPKDENEKVIESSTEEAGNVLEKDQKTENEINFFVGNILSVIQNSTIATDHKEESVEDTTEEMKTTTEKSEEIKERNNTLEVNEKKNKFSFIAEDFFESIKDTQDPVDIATTTEKSEPQAKPIPKIKSPVINFGKDNVKHSFGNILDIVDKVTKSTNKTLSTVLEKKQIDDNSVIMDETFIIGTGVVDVIKNVSKSFYNVSEEVAEVIKVKDNVIKDQKVEIVKLETIIELCLFVLLAMGLLVGVGCLCLRTARWC